MADFSSTTARPSISRALLHCLVFLVACAAGCALVGKLAPFPEVPGFIRSTAISGSTGIRSTCSSSVEPLLSSVIPAQFDATVGQVRSFNFGYDGMWPPESYFLLRQLLALRPAHLRWVVIDLMDINTQLDDRNNSTLRMAYWHDLRHTALAFREIVSSRFHWDQKLNLLWQHGRLCVGRVLNLGRGRIS